MKFTFLEVFLALGDKRRSRAACRKKQPQAKHDREMEKAGSIDLALLVVHMGVNSLALMLANCKDRGLILMVRVALALYSRFKNSLIEAISTGTGEKR